MSVVDLSAQLCYSLSSMAFILFFGSPSKESLSGSLRAISEVEEYKVFNDRPMGKCVPSRGALA
jgi:hypothetical protein